jgi:hypothetical protein
MGTDSRRCCNEPLSRSLWETGAPVPDKSWQVTSGRRHSLAAGKRRRRATRTRRSPWDAARTRFVRTGAFPLPTREWPGRRGTHRGRAADVMPAANRQVVD